MKGDTSFGLALREARKRAKRTQAEVAEHVGMMVHHISYVEHGRRAPFPYLQAISVSRFLGVSPARLLQKWACWKDEVPLHQTNDERRDLVAAALSVEWAILSPAAINRIAKEVGL